MASPTQRTLEWLRKYGWTAEVVERWCSYSRRRKDLFGFIDIVAVRTDDSPREQNGEWDFHRGILAVQATSGANTSSRVKKIRETPAHATWLDSGNRILVVGWRQLVQRKKDGTKAKRKAWKPKIEELLSGGPILANF